MLGNFTRNAALNRIKNTGTTAPTTHWISIHSADPLGTGVNETTTTYATGRASYVPANYTSPSGTISRVISNTANISFGASIASGTAPYFGVWTDEIGGSFIGGGIIRTNLGVPSPITFASGENIDIDANTLFIECPLTAYSAYEADNILNFIKGTNLTALANLYARPITAIGEITMGSRLAIAASIWGDIIVESNISKIKNSTRINFADATEDVAGVIGLGFWDVSTSGNKIIQTTRSPIDIVSGEKLFVSANKLEFWIW